MKTKLSTKAIRSPLLKLSAALGLAAFLLGGAEARAVNYAGNGNTSFGGPIGNGTLGLTDDGTNISGTLTVGANMNDVLVIYIDTGAGGGFSSTSGFQDDGDGGRTAISGYNYGVASVMTFMSGFNPQYAIALGPAAISFGGIWKLADGGANSLPYVDTVNLAPDNNTGPYTFSFPATDLGLTPGTQKTIKIFGTLISDSAYRSSEAIAGNDSGENNGWYPFTQTAFASYTFDAGAPTLTPVYFQVDMTEQIANATFTPGGGNVVNVAGSFQTNAWGGFALTNGTGTNVNIYSGTYWDANPTNTVEQYKFNINGSTWEGSDNRLFTLQSGGQTTPLVYFTDLWPSPSATTNKVTFQIDMTSAIALGDFNPESGYVEVFGTFEGPPTQWVAGFVLTNNPNGTNVNLYSGSTNDGNYPGTWEQYKYVIVQGATTNYESINNRDFATPTNAGTLPLAYFNNINSTTSVPVTFQVNMTSQIEAGNVNLGAGDTVGVAGTFQNPTWSGATLTNWPPPNTNIFSSTIVITGEPGYVYDYKFIYVSSGTTNYELPASTGTQNRVFVMPSSALTLPLVYWSDEDPANILPEATAVTFTVNMANAVDENGNPFVPSTDAVIINGTFLPDQQWNNSIWTDPFPSGDYPTQQMLEVGESSLYSQTFLVAAGSPLQIQYKYGIWHNASSDTVNINCDNEAPPYDNHSRYIRALGTYNMPVDVFGQQTNSNPAIAAEANEISFGDLAITAPSPGTIALTWLGRPGVYLQTSTNLGSGVWTTVTNSDGLSASNFPSSGSSKFFRLINP